MILRFTLTILLAGSYSVNAQDYGLLFGGGPEPTRSQFSIESNVIWFDQVLSSDTVLDYERLFGSNLTHQNEIQYQASPSSGDSWDLLSAVLNLSTENRLRYRQAVIGSTLDRTFEKENLVTTLSEQVEQLSADDSLLLLFSGHGGKGATPTDNYLYLWENTRITVQELATILDDAHEDSTIRFVFPQCFSGSFNRLAFHDLTPQTKLHSGAALCGFTSVPNDRLAEGCTSSVNSADYRDYASGLFKAMTGTDRDGRQATPAVDRDGDGRISLLEAHYSTYASGDSTDIPRATSEDYLLSLQRWPLTFASYQAAGADNIYADLAAELAYDFEALPGSRAFLSETQKRLAMARERVRQVHRETNVLKDDTNTIRKTLVNRLTLQWPGLSEPGTQAFHSAVREHLTDVDQWLRAQPESATFLTNLKRIEELLQDQIDADRNLSRHLRIQRALTLARMRQFLDNRGTESQQRTYNQLISCENWSLTED